MVGAADRLSNPMSVNSLLLPDRDKFARLFYGVTLIHFLFRWKYELFISQLQRPELTYLGTDPTYILLAFTGITKFLGDHYLAALLFDLSLVLSCVACLAFPRRIIFCVAFTMLLGLYIVVGYSFLCFHKHNLDGLWFCSLIFLSVEKKNFYFLFELIRGYCLYAYASSGFWKFYRHVWNDAGHFPVILKNDALAFLVQHPGALHSKIISWFIVHPQLLDTSMIFICCIRLGYVVGFFTKRLDWFFLSFALIFHLMSIFFLRAYFMEFSVILLTLLPLSYFYSTKAAENQ
jgi:hypothetical protein